MSGLVAVFVLALVCAVHSFPNGAPAGACISMFPKHGASAQDSASPYAITLNTTTVHSASDDDSHTVAGIAVTLESPSGEAFKGFILSGQDGDDPIGRFLVGEGAKLLDCNELTQNVVTHASKHLKLSQEVVWIPPAGFSGQVVFRATVVKNTKNFWTGIESPVVTVISG